MLKNGFYKKHLLMVVKPQIHHQNLQAQEINWDGETFFISNYKFQS